MTVHFVQRLAEADYLTDRRQRRVDAARLVGNGVRTRVVEVPLSWIVVARLVRTTVAVPVRTPAVDAAGGRAAVVLHDDRGAATDRGDGQHDHPDPQQRRSAMAQVCSFDAFSSASIWASTPARPAA